MYRFILAVSFFLCSIFAPVRNTCADLEKSLIIKHQKTEYVFDTDNSDNTYKGVTIQERKDSIYQRWKLIPSSRHGYFNILSDYNEKAIEAIDGYGVILSPYIDSRVQQWYINQEGTIMNKEFESWVLNIMNERYEPGMQIIMWNRYNNTEHNNELFTFIY